MIGESLHVTAIASSVKAATNDSGALQNPHARGCDVIIDMTVVPGVNTVTFTLQGYDPASQKWYDILASAAIVATSTVVLRVHPGATVTANVSANACLPRAFRVRAVHSAGTNFTYSVGMNLHP